MNATPCWVELDAATYLKYVARKAASVRRRDAKRGGTYSLADAKTAIHQAFCQSNGIDPYDGQPMDAGLIGAYDNAASKAQGSAYKKRFRRLPTVDHINGEPVAEFQLISWQTNDAKGDMTPAEYVEHCRAVVAMRG
jgi:hypothetical protein